MANGSNTARGILTRHIIATANRVRRTIGTGGQSATQTQAWVRQQAQGLVNSGVASNMVQAVTMVGQSVQGQGQQRAPWANMSPTDILKMRNAMGQTGWEAGTLGPKDLREYIGSGKSMNVNVWLNTNGQTFASPDSHWTVGRGANPNGTRFNENDIKRIVNKMDAGMKPLPRAVNLTRYENPQQTLEQYGIKNVSWSQVQKMDDAQLTQLFYGRSRVNQGFTSFMHNERFNRNDTFRNRGTIVEATAQQGVHAIVTKNDAEQETIIGRGYDRYATGARWGYENGQRKLIITESISPSSRSGYKDIRNW